jgi:hypothetical protein
MVHYIMSYKLKAINSYHNLVINNYYYYMYLDNLKSNSYLINSCLINSYSYNYYLINNYSYNYYLVNYFNMLINIDYYSLFAYKVVNKR